MMTGIDGFACTVNPKSQLKGTVARCDAAAEPDAAGDDVPVPLGVHATTAAAAADISASRRVSRSSLIPSRTPFPFPVPVAPLPRYRPSTPRVPTVPRRTPLTAPAARG